MTHDRRCVKAPLEGCSPCPSPVRKWVRDDVVAVARHLAETADVVPFPDADAAITVAIARQGLPPRHAITTPAFPTTTRPPAPGRTPGRTPDVER